MDWRRLEFTLSTIKNHNMTAKQLKKENIKEVQKVINSLEKLQANQSITGTYLDSSCISRFAIILYETIELIENDYE